MARRATVLGLPGEGSNPELNLDRQMMIKIIENEIRKIVNDPLRGKTPPRNAKSTIARKGGRDTPLRDTGKLLNDIRVETDEGSIKVYVQSYYFLLKRPYRLLFRMHDMKRSIGMAVKQIANKLVRIV